MVRRAAVVGVKVQAGGQGFRGSGTGEREAAVTDNGERPRSAQGAGTRVKAVLMVPHRVPNRRGKKLLRCGRRVLTTHPMS